MRWISSSVFSLSVLSFGCGGSGGGPAESGSASGNASGSASGQGSGSGSGSVSGNASGSAASGNASGAQAGNCKQNAQPSCQMVDGVPIHTWTYEAEASTHHDVGTVDGAAWSVPSSASAGYLTFGPYATDWKPGGLRATFRLKSTEPRADKPLAFIDVLVDNKVVTRRRILITDNTWKDYSLDFTVPANQAGKRTEARVHFNGQGQLSHDYTTITQLPPKATAALRDPGFEEFDVGSSVWAVTSTNGFWIPVHKDKVPSPAAPRTGNYVAWMGGEDSEMGSLSQTLTLSASPGTLRFWHWLDTSEDGSGDNVFVKVNGTVVWSLVLRDNEPDEKKWKQVSINMNAYASQMVTLAFEVSLDAGQNSNWFLDDISIGP